MTSEERFLTRGVAQPVFRGGSGVNGFAQRFAELRSFAAKNLRSRENNRERILARARGMGDCEKAENLTDDLDVAGVVDLKPT
jgi:hypothetical protein